MSVTEGDGDKTSQEAYYVKPMNCPFHIQAYLFKKYSYRDLPLRWAELGTVYRYEKDGVRHGLFRVRGFTQDDAHIFCAPEKIEDEIRFTVRFCLKILRRFGFTDISAYLSTKPEKAVGDPAKWEQATNSLRHALESEGLAYEVDEGGGAFYGPKIDMKIKDALGREWQLGTIQFDFNLPERFHLTYTGEDGKEHQPYMVHRALLGSLERFFGILIEHYAGAFPTWLAPVQAAVLNITDAQLPFAPQGHPRQDPLHARHRRARGRGRPGRRPQPREGRPRHHDPGGLHQPPPRRDRRTALTLHTTTGNPNRSRHLGTTPQTPAGAERPQSRLLHPHQLQNPRARGPRRRPHRQNAWHHAHPQGPVTRRIHGARPR